MINSEYKDLSEYKRNLICFKEIFEMYKESNLEASDFLVDYYYDLKGYMKEILGSSSYSLIVPFIVNCETIEKNLEIYNPILENYYNVLKEYSSLAKRLNLNNSLLLSNFLSLLLYGGYFSVYGIHNPGFSNRYLINGLYALDVVNGCGVCLNNANLLKDFLSVCNYNSNTLLCKTSKEMKFDYHLKINKTLSEVDLEDSRMEILKKLIFEKIMFKISDIWKMHLVTLVKDREKFYIYDPTNIAVFNIESLDNANLVGGIGNLKLMPIKSIQIGSSSDFFDLFRLLDNHDFKDMGYKREEVLESFEKVIKILNDNLELVVDSYKNIHDDLVKISTYLYEVNQGSKSLKKGK